MLDELTIRQSEAVASGRLRFGVMYVIDSGTKPEVGVAATDRRSGDEGRYKVHPGESFEFGGQTWKIAEIRYPSAEEWEVVLHRVG